MINSGKFTEEEAEELFLMTVEDLKETIKH